MEIPAPLLDSLRQVHGFDEQSFLEAHFHPPPVSIRINPAKIHDEQQFLGRSGMQVRGNIPWCSRGYYLDERPKFTLDPALHAGAYYVQEASSMFLHYLIDQLTQNQKDLSLLDLCAAPGGKTTLLSSLPQIKLIVANEVIRTRVSILNENVVKWGDPKVLISQNDPSHFKKLKGYFDIMLVDAPCSGSGLFRKDAAAMNEWSISNVNHCAERQKRILADAVPALKEGGLLVYSTCSYSPEENEGIMEWLMAQAGLEPIDVQIPVEWGIKRALSASGAIGYRFFPGNLEGEGFFVSAFRQKNSHAAEIPVKSKYSLLMKNEIALLHDWVSQEVALQFLKLNNDIFLLSESIFEDFITLSQFLNIRKTGVHAGSLAYGQFIPEHELALSTLLNKGASQIQVNLEQALQFLRKQMISIEIAEKGWYILTYNNLPLGLIKYLGNRINNYYPTAWRILMS